MNQVLIFSSTPGTGSGAERVLEYLLSSASVRPLVAGIIAPAESNVAAFASAQGYPWIPWNCADDSFHSGSVATLRLLAHYQPPVKVRTIHAWHTRGFEFALAMSKKWRFSPTATLHDHPVQKHSALRRILLQFSSNRLARMAVVSDALASACRDQGWTVPISIIKNGLPDEPTTPQRSPDQRSTAVRVGFVGLNARWKGIDTLCSVAARTADIPIEWRIYGQTVRDTAPILAELLAAHSDRVCLAGYRKPAEIFSEIDLLFHPSLSFDPFPTALLEAARAGIPVLASDVGGTAEIVKNQVTGALFSPEEPYQAAQALRALFFEGREKLDALGKNARLHYEQSFSLEAMAARYIQFWR